MTFFVLLNTVGMSMQKYNMDLMTVYIIEFAGEIFTWIFICEMVSRIIAIGPVKYLRDKMNWLDGGIVSLSIFEMLLTKRSCKKLTLENGSFITDCNR